MVTSIHSQGSHSTLLEVSRKALVNKSRVQSRKRFDRRLNYQVSNFRGVDLEQLFEHDYFVFQTPIKDYVCTIAFPGVFSSLQDVVKSTNGDPKKINLQMVIKALRIAFDATDDVKVDCTCPDFWYRFSYVATQNGYKYGEPQTIPADITNPDDDIGSTCKHLSLLLSNKQWVVKAASVVNAFIKAYPEKSARYLYDESEIVDNAEDEIVTTADEVEETPDEVDEIEVPDEVEEVPEDDTESSETVDSADNEETPAPQRRTPKRTNQRKSRRKTAKKSRQYNRNKESLDIGGDSDMVRLIKEATQFGSMGRGELIDFIEEIYDSDRWAEVESAIAHVTGAEDLSDEGPEGVYSDLSVEELQTVAKMLAKSEKTYSVNLTQDQISLVKRAVSALTKTSDAKSSEAAKSILSILQGVD